MMKNNIDNLKDEELIELVLENEDMFLHLMRRYESKLIAYILRISSFSYEEAEDILQDVFIKVYKNLNNFDTSLKFSSWIYRITHNEVISNFRKNKKVIQISDQELQNDIFEKIIDDFDIKEKIDNDYLRKNLMSILNKLDAKYRDVLVLKYFEEKEYSEISDILKKPVGTIATLLFRAKKELKKIIKTENINLSV